MERALKQSPGRIDREEVQVGVDHYTVLPGSYVSQEEYAMISSGQKVFYAFVVLSYYDDSLPVGQFLVNEFCAWQEKDFSHFQLCKGHNKIWLYKKSRKQ
jgi:hypothetical protein